MGVEDHAPSAAEVAEAATSEAQIAVHWREEEVYPPPPSFVAQANAADPAILERFSEERYPPNVGCRVGGRLPRPRGACWPDWLWLPPAASSNCACGSPAHSSPTSFTDWHTQS